MTTTDPLSAEIDNLPSFELEYYYDDLENPQEVTLFNPAAQELSTRWLTVDLENSIQLDQIA